MPDVADDVIQGLYEAAVGVVPWSHTLGRWHAAGAPLFALQLLLLEPEHRRIMFSEASPQSHAEAVQEHARHWHQASPHIPHLLAQPVGELLHTAERFPPERYADHPFYRDYWARYGVRSVVAAKVAHCSQGAWIVAASRTHEQPPFTATDLLQLQRFVGHAVAAFGLAARLQPVQAAAVVGEGLMQGSTRPMLMLDGRMRLLDTNPAGAQWLARSAGLRVHNGCLEGHDGATTAALQQALQRVGLGGAAPADGADPATQRAVLRLASPGGESLLCSLWNLRPQDSLGGAGAPAGMALLTVQAADEPPAIDAQWLGAMFSLTPAEVAVATQLMRGLEAKQIARAHHRSLHTVRSQMRSLLQKTGSRRQADLVRVLMHAAQL